jgi:hypothetical protein
MILEYYKDNIPVGEKINRFWGVFCDFFSKKQTVWGLGSALQMKNIKNLHSSRYNTS